MIPVELMNKLRELDVIDNLDNLSEEQVIEAIIDKLDYYSKLVTPGLLKIVEQHKKVKSGKLALKEEITGDMCLELYNKYHSLRMVGDKLGVSVCTVRKRLRDMEVILDDKDK